MPLNSNKIKSEHKTAWIKFRGLIFVGKWKDYGLVPNRPQSLSQSKAFWEGQISQAAIFCDHC